LKKLVSAWISFRLRYPALFWLLFIAFLGFSTLLAARSEVEAFPEFTNVQVQVITLFNGKAAEEVERQITVPLEVATNGIQGLINQRSISTFGLSVITLTFDDGIEGRQARLDVSQRLADADLPEGVKPSLSPDSTPVGEIFRYTVQGELPVDELKLIEDWQLEREFKSIPGVADVVSFGGPTRTIEAVLDVTRLKAIGLTVSAVAQALGQNHANAGGAQIQHGDESYVVRSLGLYEKPENLDAAVIATQKGVPVRVRDIGHVQLGHKPRLGIVGHNDADDSVEGIVLLRTGSDSAATCAAIRERIAKLNAGGLPPGVSIRPYYDRTNLIKLSSQTVLHNILFGVFLVCVILLFGFGPSYWPVTAAVAVIIPFSLLVVFTTLRLLGFTPNLISLGAVDFGIIIETAIFGAEAVIAAHALAEDEESAFSGVLGPALLCAILLVIAFIPILSLQRVEGRIFRPLGITLVAALVGGQLGTFLFVPMALPYLPRVRNPVDKLEHFFTNVVRRCQNVGLRVSSLRRPGLVVGGLLTAAILTLGALVGREFLPSLNEGALYIRATAPSTISMEAASDLAARIRQKIREIPEVTDVVSQTGRPDDGTDVNGFDNIELFVAMVPPSQWKSAHTIDGFNALAQEKLKGITGVDFNYSQPIKDNVDEAISGVKGELVIKLYGPNLAQLQSLGDKIAGILRQVDGAEDVGSEQILGQPELRFTMNREVLSRYGLRVTDAEEVLESALAGKVAAKMIDEQGRSVNIVVRPELPRVQSVNVLASLPVLTPDGARVPLGEVSNPKLVEGVSRVYREGGERRLAVKCSVRNRPVVEFVAEADRRITSAVPLPPHYRTQWSGSFENAERASRQLLLVVPLCLIAIVAILYTWFGAWAPVALLLWEVPFAALGGLLFLKLFSLNLSISAAAGGIVLGGVTLLTGMMLVSATIRLGDPFAALREKGRSIILSNGVAIIGLIPAALSHGIGSETAKPFAVIILGGLLSSLVLSLTVLPALAARTLIPKSESSGGGH
jgi:cobalt-zinc-cadmium resistance protein CzcA